jgi:hypothetical protein
MLLFALPDRAIAAILLKLIPAGCREDVQQAQKCVVFSGEMTSVSRLAARTTELGN